MKKIILIVTALSALFTSCNMLEDSWFDWSDDSYSAYISRSYDDAKHEDLVIRNKEAYINLTQGAGGTMMSSYTTLSQCGSIIYNYAGDSFTQYNVTQYLNNYTGL